ncbi:MAG: type II secretion system protein [Deltaproteobacteria bacterium]|nr:type II secretion system protein [Deltaproteobacteria bacterium]
MKTKGFTLIETVMVIVLLGIVAAGILLYFAGMRGSADPVLRLQAIELAQEKMERIIADKKTTNGFNNVIAEAAVPLGAPFTNFTRSVTVICVQEAALNTSSGTMPNCTDISSYHAKNVTVNVTWTGGGSTGISLVTVLSDY